MERAGKATAAVCADDVASFADPPVCKLPRQAYGSFVSCWVQDHKLIAGNARKIIMKLEKADTVRRWSLSKSQAQFFSFFRTLHCCQFDKWWRMAISNGVILPLGFVHLSDSIQFAIIAEEKREFVTQS